MDNGGTLYGLISAIVAFIGGGVWFWYDKKEKDKAFNRLATTVNAVEKRQIEQDSKFITEQGARKIVKEDLETFRADLSEVKINVNNIAKNLSELTSDIRVLTAVQDLLNNKVK